MVCKNCKKPLNKGEKYCSNCGEFNIKDNSSMIKKVTIILLGLVLIGLLSYIAFNNVDNTIIYEDGYDHSRTIMIYLDGSNLESDSGIASADIESIDGSLMNPKDRVYIYTGGTSKWKNEILNTENAIYRVDGKKIVKEKTYSQENMGNPNTLTTFLKYVYENSKTDRYDLIFYNHGGAIDGAIYDDFSYDHLSISDFSEALKGSPFNTDNKLELVLFRTCLNGTIEIANTFKDYAHYLVASEELTYGHAFLPVLSFINEIDKKDTAVDVGKKFIKHYSELIDKLFIIGEKPTQTYSIIDLKRIDTINKELNEYIKTFDLSNNFGNVSKVRSSLYQYGQTTFDYPQYDTVDMYSLFENLNIVSNDNTRLLNAIKDAVVYNWSTNDSNHGLSIFLPYRGTTTQRNNNKEIYNKLSFSSEYISFVNKFNDLFSSGTSSSYKTFNYQTANTFVKDRSEFSLELTDEEVNDYASSLYFVFKKEADGKYTLVYTSDNTNINKNTLTTNITNNLVGVKDNNEIFYIPVVERTTGNNKSRSFGGLLENFTSDYVMKSARWFIDNDKDGNPVIINAILNCDNDKGVSGAVANLDDYTTYSILSSHYDILDANGNYKEAWDNNGVIQGYEFKKDNFKMENVSLTETDEYYCVFRIYDIYGNYYYSKLINLK